MVKYINIVLAQAPDNIIAIKQQWQHHEKEIMYINCIFYYCFIVKPSDEKE